MNIDFGVLFWGGLIIGAAAVAIVAGGVGVIVWALS